VQREDDLQTGGIEHLVMNQSQMIQGISGRPLSKEWLKVRRMNRLNQELYDLLGGQ
jgi:hypothetical protein